MNADRDAVTGVAASLARRLVALAYDGLLFAALLVVVGFLTIPLAQPSPAPGGPLRVPDLPARVLSFALVFAVGGLYFGWSWSGHRRTLAMKTWRIALERAGGAPLDARAALVRYAASWIGPAVAVVAYVALSRARLSVAALPLLGLNYAWALVDRDRQFLHDRIAGTRVVERQG